MTQTTMTTKPDKLLISIKWFTDIAYYLSIALVPIVIILSVLTSFIPLGDEVKDMFTASIPMSGEITNIPFTQLEPNNETVSTDSAKAAVVIYQGVLNIPLQHKAFIVFSNASHVIIMVLVIAILFFVRKMIRSALKNEPFAEHNGHYLTYIGYLLIASPFMESALQFILVTYLKNFVQLSNAIHLTAIDFNFGDVFVGVLILILAQVFKYGTTLQQDKNLTV